MVGPGANRARCVSLVQHLGRCSNDAMVTCVAVRPRTCSCDRRERVQACGNDISFLGSYAPEFGQRIWTRTPATTGRGWRFAFLGRTGQKFAEPLFASPGPR